MIKKKTGILTFKEKENCNNDVYYFIGDYISIFNKFFFFKNGILLSVLSSNYEIIQYSSLSRIPKRLEKVELDFDLIQRIFIHEKVKRWIRSNNPENYKYFLQLTWKDELIEKYKIKLYITISKNIPTPTYIFGIKDKDFIHGIELNSEKCRSKYYRSTLRNLELCEPVMFSDDIIKIESIVGKYNFISEIDEDVVSSINKELDKLIDEA